jgi:hypothetical protein
MLITRLHESSHALKSGYRQLGNVRDLIATGASFNLGF